MRPPSPSIPEQEFLLSSLSQSLRLDGRQLLEMREPRLTFGPELGSVEVELGKTRVLASVSAHMTKPPPERPFEGILSIHSELSPMTGTEYESGRPTDEETHLTRTLDKLIRRSDALDKESLCIVAGQRVWHLSLTIHVLSDSGNQLSGACLAAIVALKHFRRPEVEVVGGDEVIVHAPTERSPLPLSLHHTPYLLTFAFFPPPTSITKSKSDTSDEPNATTVLDPNLLESRLAVGFLEVGMNAQRELVMVQKTGSPPLPPSHLLSLISTHAVDRIRYLDKLVEAALERDWEGRRAAVEVV